MYVRECTCTCVYVLTHLAASLQRTQHRACEDPGGMALRWKVLGAWQGDAPLPPPRLWEMSGETHLLVEAGEVRRGRCEGAYTVGIQGRKSE